MRVIDRAVGGLDELGAPEGRCLLRSPADAGCRRAARGLATDKQDRPSVASDRLQVTECFAEWLGVGGVRTQR
jgi:hypothetical protein